MKTYQIPTLESVELAANERIAIELCEKDGYLYFEDPADPTHLVYVVYTNQGGSRAVLMADDGCQANLYYEGLPS